MRRFESAESMGPSTSIVNRSVQALDGPVVRQPTHSRAGICCRGPRLPIHLDHWQGSLRLLKPYRKVIRIEQIEVGHLGQHPGASSLTFLSKLRKSSSLIGNVARQPRKAAHLFERNSMAEPACKFCLNGFEDVSPQTSIDPTQVATDNTPTHCGFTSRPITKGAGDLEMDPLFRHLSKALGQVRWPRRSHC